jgi:signal peptidase II
VIKRSKTTIILCISALVLLTTIDLWSKRWAEEALSASRNGQHVPLCVPDESGYISTQRMRISSIPLINDFLEFRYAENCGAAFGMLNDSPVIFRSILFLTAATIAVFALFWMLVTGTGGPLFAISVPLVTAGAFGNLIDRVNNGYVVDFIRFHIYEAFEWPTFNFADITITIGVVLLVLDGLRRPLVKPAPESSDGN